MKFFPPRSPYCSLARSPRSRMMFLPRSPSRRRPARSATPPNDLMRIREDRPGIELHHLTGRSSAA